MFIILATLSLYYPSFAQAHEALGTGCLLENQDVREKAAKNAMYALKTEAYKMKLEYVGYGVGNVDVAASRDCPSLEIVFEQKNSVVKFRGIYGDFFLGFPVIYSVGGPGELQ